MNISIQLFLIFVNFFINIQCKGELKSLDETTWGDMLKGEWMVEFFAPWCPACQQLKPLWEEFAKWSDDLGIKVGNVDLTTNPGLSGRFMITALPTIFHVKDGVFRQYRGARDKDSFFSFVEEKKWQSLDPVSTWVSPQSYPMTVVSYFFKLSMFLRSLHTTIVQDLGVPYWGSYIIFGIATIIIGTLLGLIIVCILDFFTRARTADADYDRLADNTDFESERNNENEGIYEGEDVIKEDMQEENELRRRTESNVR